jgi:hypothetical protein
VPVELLGISAGRGMKAKLRFVQIDLEPIERRLFAHPTICSLITRDYGVEPEPESPKELAYVVIGGS